MALDCESAFFVFPFLSFPFPTRPSAERVCIVQVHGKRKRPRSTYSLFLLGARLETPSAAREKGEACFSFLGERLLYSTGTTQADCSLWQASDEDKSCAKPASTQGWIIVACNEAFGGEGLGGDVLFDGSMGKPPFASSVPIG